MNTSLADITSNGVFTAKSNGMVTIEASAIDDVNRKTTISFMINKVVIATPTPVITILPSSTPTPIPIPTPTPVVIPTIFTTTAEYKVISAVDIGGTTQTTEQRFRSTHDWGAKNNYASGFPNFHQADYGNGIVYGNLFLKLSTAEYKVIPAIDIGGTTQTTEQRFRSVHDWAVKNSYVGGFPNFHQADYGNGIVFGTVLIRSNYAEYKVIPAIDIGGTNQTTEQRFRSVHDWAVKNGYVGGFPNFHQADYGNGIVYGIILFK